MSLYTAVANIVGAASFFGTAILAYLFYRDFFAADRHPVEWRLLYAGFASLAVSLLLQSFAQLHNTSWLPELSAVVSLLGAALLMMGGFVLWHKFRL